MKFFILFLFATTLQLSASVYSQEAKVTLHMQDASFEEVVKALENSTRYTFLYRDHQIASIKKLNLKYTEIDIKEVLKDCLKGSGLTFVLVDNTIVIQPSGTLVADTVSKITVKGVVKDEKGETLPGVTILLKGTKIGFATDAKGAFNITIPQSKEITLVFSFVGYLPQEVIVKNDGKPLYIKMKENMIEMDEVNVIVTGIFNKPKESNVGAISHYSGEQLKMAGNRNMLQALNNLDPSFRIVESNAFGSDPNRLPEIQIRGASSLPGLNEMQGDGRASLNTPLFILDGFEITLERMMDLNMEEVESITMLKDASSTAMYGSKGANGVMVITSKVPKEGRLRVSYTASLNLELVDLSSYDLMNSREKLDLEYMAGLYTNEDPEKDIALKKMYADKRELVRNGLNTNWMKIPVRNGVGHSHNLSISGGDQNFRYGANFSYNQIVGAMKGSDRKNFNGTVDLAYYREKIQFSNSTTLGINESNVSPYGSFSGYVSMNPYWDPYDSDGFPVPFFEKKKGNEKNHLFANPVANPLYDALLPGFNVSKYTEVTNNFSIQYRPIKGLQLGVNIGFNKKFSNDDAYTSSSHSKFNGDDYTKKGQYDYSNGRGTSIDASAQVSYGRTFGKHNIYAGFHWSIQQTMDESISFSLLGYMNDKLNGVGNALDYVNKPGSSESTKRNVGFTGTLNYSYANRYYMDMSYRLDGASSFGSQKRFAPFWTVGCGYNLAEENFVKNNLGFISMFKIRMNYGVTGSMSFSPYQAMTMYNYLSDDTSGTHTYTNSFGMQLYGYGNKDLEWQTTYQFNVGGDWAFFNNRLSFTVNYYRKKTENQITSMALPLSNGYSSYIENFGSVRNTGYDIDFSYYVIRNTERQIMWSVRAGISHNKNVLLELSPAVKESVEKKTSDFRISDMFYLYREGESMSAIYAVHALGVDPSTGKMVYQHSDGTPTYHYDGAARIYCGDNLPKLDGRLSTSMQYKSLSVNIGFSLRAGGQQYNGTYATKIENVNYLNNADRRVLTVPNRWMKPGDMAQYTGFENKESRQSDRYIQDERTFSCNNINVGYDFTQTWVRKMLGMERITLSGSVSNIFYISTIKRERGTDYPFAVQPTFSLTCVF